MWSERDEACTTTPVVEVDPGPVLSNAAGRVAAVGKLQHALAQFAVSQAAAMPLVSRPLKGSATAWTKQFDVAAFAAAKHRVHTKWVKDAYTELAGLG